MPVPGLPHRVGDSLTTSQCHSLRLDIKAFIVTEDCGSPPPGRFNQRKVMKRLEGMIYGERLASEQSRGRKENSLKVVEITEDVEERREELGEGGVAAARLVLTESCQDAQGRGEKHLWGEAARPRPHVQRGSGAASGG